MGAWRFGQRNLLAHHRAQSLILESRDDGSLDARRILRRDVPQSHAQNSCITRHGVARIYFDASPAADDHHTTVRREDAKVFPQIYIREHFENDVESATTCSSERAFKMSGGVVVEYLVRALRSHQLPSAIGAGSSGYMQSCRSRELHGSDPHATAGAVDQNAFAPTSMRSMKERAVCSRIGNVDCCALCKRNV